MTRAPAALLGVLLLVLAGCSGFGDGPSPANIVQQQGLPPADQTVIGDGSVTVAMLLPLSAGGSASGLAQSFQNAAQLAMDETAQDNIRIVVADTAGTSENAKLAADAAIAQGATLILGPVFAPAVSGAAPSARAAEIPIIAFSTDSSVSGNGVYLLSFLPKQDASRIVSYAASQGMSSFSALVPNNGYGLVVEAAFREAVAANRGRIAAVERYEPGAVADAARTIASRNPAEAIFIPNGGDDPGTAATALREANVTSRLLGSGQWDSPAVLGATALRGSWYPGAGSPGYQSFVERYDQKFGATPPRTASLVYDAVLLANGLVAARGPSAFTAQSLRNPDGFLGVDGIFRFTSRGLSERGLAVFEVDGNGGSSLVSDAPTTFRPT